MGALFSVLGSVFWSLLPEIALGDWDLSNGQAFLIRAVSIAFRNGSTTRSAIIAPLQKGMDNALG